MPITVEWYDQERGILLNVFSNYWTWQECINAVDIAIELSNQVERVDTIIDMRASNIILPSGVLRYMPQIADKVAHALPHWGVSVIVSNSKLIEALLTVNAKFSNHVRLHYPSAKTVEDALVIIENDRSEDS